jgi:hypothetical protein
MKTLILALAVAAGGLCGCAGLTAPGGVGKQVLSNLEGCDRHYEGAIGAGVNGSFRIDCKAKPVAVPASADQPPQ